MESIQEKTVNGSDTIFDRGRSTILRLWKDVTRGSKDRLSTLSPDLAPDELSYVETHMRMCLSGLGGAVSARVRAAELGRAYLGLNPSGKRQFFELLASKFGPDEKSVRAAAEALVETRDYGDFITAKEGLFDAMKSPRLELLKQFNSLESGVKFLVDMRLDLLETLKTYEVADPDLVALNNEILGLLASWFDLGFLELRRITWDAPASLLEKIVESEAVHAIRSANDLRRRLKSDRRFYAFFHPSMPNEPLIFVEIALLDHLAANIQDVLHDDEESIAASDATTAIFYSISNAQEGLSGISFGDFLIKRVVRELTAELPSLKTFATLSPIPGFQQWLAGRLDQLENMLSGAQFKVLSSASADSNTPVSTILEQAFKHEDRLNKSDWDETVKPVMMRLCALYLTDVIENRHGQIRAIDPVAHFHLSNGARIECLNWLADQSAKGYAQSAGMMVNYFYKLSDIEQNHESYMTEGVISASKGVKSLC